MLCVVGCVWWWCDMGVCVCVSSFSVRHLSVLVITEGVYSWHSVNKTFLNQFIFKCVAFLIDHDGNQLFCVAK